MSVQDVSYYAIYCVGSFALLYAIVFIIRYVLMFYLIRAMKKMMDKIPAFEKRSHKGESSFPKEDERLRDQENELFKEQANKIHAHLLKAQEQDDNNIIDVNVEKIGIRSNYGDVFTEGKPRLKSTMEEEIIVGISMPIGKLASILLAKKQKEFINEIFYKLQQDKGVESTKWRDFVTSRKSQEIFRNMS